MTLSNTIGTVLAVLAFVAIAAGIYAALRVNLRRATVDIWREQAEALTARLETVEASDKECKAKLAAMAAANALLVDRIAGVEAIAALDAASKQQHSEVMAALWSLAAGRTA